MPFTTGDELAGGRHRRLPWRVRHAGTDGSLNARVKPVAKRAPGTSIDGDRYLSRGGGGRDDPAAATPPLAGAGSKDATVIGKDDGCPV